MQQKIIISEKNSQLAVALADRLKIPLATVTFYNFADTESTVIFNDQDSFLGRDCIVVCQFVNKEMGAGCWDVNTQIINFLFLIYGLKNRGAQTITLVMPYYPYSRHDKIIESSSGSRFGELDCITSLYRFAGARLIITVDVHNKQVFQDNFVCSVALTDWWAMRIREHIVSSELHNQIVLVSPDKGSFYRVAAIGEQLDIPVVTITKNRVGPDSSIALGLDGIVQDMHAVIVDDIIDTGITANNAVSLLMQQGAKKISACFSHAIVSKLELFLALSKKCEKIYLTNSIVFSTKNSILPSVLFSLDSFLIDQVVALLEVTE